MYNIVSKRVKYYLIGAFFGVISVVLFLFAPFPGYVSLIGFALGSLVVATMQEGQQG